MLVFSFVFIRIRIGLISVVISLVQSNFDIAANFDKVNLNKVIRDLDACGSRCE